MRLGRPDACSVPATPIVDPQLRRAGIAGLLGKNVLMTGGSSGIGQAIAVRFAEHGANVAINYLTTPDEAAGTEGQVHACVRRVQQQGVRDVLVQGDVSSEDDVVRMVGEATRAPRRPRHPGQQRGHPALAPVRGAHQRGLRQGARGQPARRVPLRPRGDQAIRGGARTPGVVINVSSVHQLIPKPNYLGYSVSKGGMQNLTRTLALEFAGRGIRVNGIGPGATITPINRAWIDDPVKSEMVDGHIPLRPGRRRRTRWPASARSSPPTTPPTSPGRRSSSTAG